MSQKLNRLLGVGVVVVAAVAVLVSGTSGEQVLLESLLVGHPTHEPTIGHLRYGSGILAIGAVIATASWLTRRDPRMTGFLRGITVVSALGVLILGAVALLSAGFWTTARGVGGADAVAVTLLFVAAWIAPAVGSLLGGILLLVRHAHSSDGSRRLNSA